MEFLVKRRMTRSFPHFDGSGRLQTGRLGGFSLIELLSVVVIILVSMSLLVPAFQGIMQSSSLTSTAASIQDELSLARALAVANTRRTQVRFYRFGEGNHYRAMRVFLETPNGTPEAARRIVRLPDGIIIDSGGTLSPVLATTPSSSGSETNAAPGLPSPVPYAGFRFEPSGAVDVASSATNSYFTVRALTDSASPPRNFATILIQPETGRATTFRP